VGLSPEEERHLDKSEYDTALASRKVLGGGSSINGRIFFRGDPRNYDYWERLGNQGGA
jgi:choline dehydrogenase-like flavoprotein